MKLSKKGIVFFAILLLLLLSACSSNTGGKEESKEKEESEEKTNVEANEEDSDEEVTLTFVAPWSEEQVESRFKADFEAQYPNIKIEPISAWTDTEAFEELFSKNIVPDVSLVLGDFEEMNELDMVYPLDDLVEKNNMDLNKFREGAIEAIRSRDPEGEGHLLGIPVEDVVIGLFYNKEIFDKFGVNYPTDGMTWDEVIDLATKVTGERDGTQYYGLETHSLSQAILQLSVTGTDPETGEVLFDQKPEYAQYFNLIKKIHDIPGNIPDNPDDKSGLEGRNVAMNLRTVSNIPVFLETEGLDFDVVSFPSWPDNPNVAPNNLPLTLAISPESEHKEAAFKLLEFITSKEQQINMAKIGVAPVLGDAEIRSYLAYKDGEKVEGLNIEGIYSGTPAEPAEYSPYGPDVLLYGGNFIGEMTTEFVEEYRESGTDVNTFIREMQEKYEAKIEEEKNKK
ncbi:ABC transporter substrate-binding protein [Bacillus sp. SD088]|uniref:ABC transporter substrate-binding protein n=1 Tax=Bacillus sp. SD088 TaxID=2782012 RepID=UPI001A9628AF|nr:extracellular solute-binding protein [Bacillus sp. SD088]MBO0993284.1 extracellular solute-binding protein [Bacillus sp. SD088]